MPNLGSARVVPAAQRARLRRWASAGFAALCAHAAACGADPYPTRPVRLVVPFPPGGATDIVARIVAERLTPLLGHPVITDNRGGASGNIGAEIVAHAAPDGHTLLMATTGVMAVNESLFARLPYDPVRDFAPVSLTTSLPLLLIVPPSVQLASVADVVATARSSPGRLSFASSGAGATTHVSGELFKALAKVNILHVPYKGGGQLISDLLAGHVSMSFFQIPGAIQHIRTGKLKALGISTAKRSYLMPDVPTIAEAGVPGYESIAWSGIAAPARTSRAVVEGLSAQIDRILREPGVRERLAGLGAEAVGGRPEAFGDYVRSERAKWSRLLKDAGVQAQ